MSDPATALIAALEGDSRRFVEILEQIPAVVAVIRGPDLVIEFANPHYRRLVGDRPMVGRPVAEVFDEPDNRHFVDLLAQVYASGEPFYRQGAAGRGPGGEDVFYDFAYVPLRTPDGAVDGVLVHAVDVTAQVGAVEAAESSELRFRTLADSNIFGVCIADAERMLEANDAFLTMVGCDRADLEAGRVSWRSMTPPEYARVDELALADLRGRGRVETYEKEFVRPDGVRVPVACGAATLTKDPFRCIAFFMDLTERHAAERDREILLAREREARREAELAAGRIARLQRVTAALSAAISTDEVARLVVEHALDAGGAAAAVVTLRDGNRLHIRSNSGYEDSLIEGWSSFSVEDPVPLADAVRTGAIILLESGEECMRRYPALERSARRYEAIAAVPLVFHGQALGSLGLSYATPHTFSAGERGFLLALGRQCAQALERARLYEERAYVAQTLQQGLLPERIAEVPGLDVAVRYHSISDGGEVGGDFYDLFDVAEDRWVLAIGDVCGKGTAAAVLTGLARHTIRAIAMRMESPEGVLAFLNEAMRRQLGAGSYCTVGCATLSPLPGGRFSACLASGGHTYPLLLRPGEAVREIEVPGTLLGFVPGLTLEPVSLELDPGDTLVFYTDGITDARGDGERFGEERLRATLEEAREAGAEEIAQAVDDAVRRHQPDRPKDDRAIMVLRVTG